MTPKDPLFGGDFLGQILAADSLPGAFVHSRKNLIFTENPYRRLLRTLLRRTYC